MDWRRLRKDFWTHLTNFSRAIQTNNKWYIGKHLIDKLMVCRLTLTTFLAFHHSKICQCHTIFNTISFQHIVIDHSSDNQHCSYRTHTHLPIIWPYIKTDLKEEKKIRKLNSIFPIFHSFSFVSLIFFEIWKQWATI